MGVMRLSNLADVDHGLAVLWRPDWAQLMPHAGPRVVQRLIDATVNAGARMDASPEATDVYPEATSHLEADVLATIARAASPAAVDLLVAQSAMWREVLSRHATVDRAALLTRSRSLDRLVDPPTVVVVGQPNVGKSTLTNAMLGRGASVVADLPGTTRDWVAGMAELSVNGSPHAAVAVRWLDTPGLRQSEDAIEQQAIRAARFVIDTADVLIVMRDDVSDWPDASAMPREAGLYLVNKCDRDHASIATAGTGTKQALHISAQRGDGLGELTRCIMVALDLESAHAPECWAFSDTLKQWAETGDHALLAQYLTDL